MGELDTIRAYYEKVVAGDFPHALPPDDGRARLKAVTIRGCHGNSTNLLFFSARAEDGVLRDLRYDCQYCDVVMYVTAELLCQLAAGRPVAALAGIGEEEIATALGGPSKKVARQAVISLGLLREGLATGSTAE